LSISELGQQLALPLAWVLVIAGFSIALPNLFLSIANFSSIFGSQAMLVVLSLGLMVPMIAGEFDLSVASILGLSSMTVAVLNGQDGWPIWPVVAIALLTGAAVGFVNGAIVVLIGIESMIVTIGTASILLGVILWISNSATISGISLELVNSMVGSRFAGIPLEFYYGLLLCLVVWYVLEYTPLGRELLFVGRGRSAARLAGVNVDGIRWGTFVVSGLIAALAGVVWAGTTGAADPSSASSFLLPAFAAVFLGGTSITPGRFNPWGTVIAVYFLVTGVSGLQILGVRSFVQQLFYGGALVAAVALSRIVSRRRQEAAEPLSTD
jgi:ribose transport system permease protein